MDPSHDSVPDRLGERGDPNPLAAVYLALRKHLSREVAIEIVDPRNHVYLLPVLYSAARRRGMGVIAALGAALWSPGYAAIIVDGEPVSSGELPAPTEALRLVTAALAVPHAGPG